MINRPFKRTYRPNRETSSLYEHDERFAINGRQYIENFKLIQKDLLHLFDYVEPCEENKTTFSMRIHELYVRACIEVESNFVAILKENDYSKHGNWNIVDFKKINATHLLSKYSIKVPHWHGRDFRFAPFQDWENTDTLFWYQAYNKIKHNKYKDYSKANLFNLLNAVSANLILLSSQFFIHDINLFWDMYNLGNESTHLAIGKYFQITFPDFPDEMKYNFNWQEIKGEPEPFENLQF